MGHAVTGPGAAGPVPAGPAVIEPLVAGAEVLAGLARLGPFFALDTHPARSAPVPPWRPLAELFQLPGVLGARVAAVRSALAEASGRPVAAVEPRVAASMAQLGLAARLICPALGVAVLTGGLLEVDPARMRWQPSTAPVALSIPDDLIASVTAGRWDGASLADALAASVLTGPVRALVEASRSFGVSEQVLWGNVASVVAGAVALIGAAAPGLATATDPPGLSTATDPPDLTGRAEALVTRLLHQPPLQGRHQASGQGGFRRRNCCLVYRLADASGPVCGDCVLDRAPTPARRASAPAE